MHCRPGTCGFSFYIAQPTCKHKSGRKVKKCPGKFLAWLLPSFAQKMIFLQWKEYKKAKMKFSIFWLNIGHQKFIRMEKIQSKWTESESEYSYIWMFRNGLNPNGQSFCDSFSTVGLKMEAERNVQFQDMPLYLRCLPLPSLPILLSSLL